MGGRLVELKWRHYWAVIQHATATTVSLHVCNVVLSNRRVI